MRFEIVVALALAVSGCSAGTDSAERLDPEPVALLPSVEQLVLDANDATTLTVTATTADGSPWAGALHPQWSCSDPTVASVSDEGKIVGLSSGDATISVVAADLAAEIPIRVRGFEVAQQLGVSWSQWTRGRAAAQPDGNGLLVFQGHPGGKYELSEALADGAWSAPAVVTAEKGSWAPDAVSLCQD